MNQRIEELSLNAWSALHTLVYDGWLLRFTGGYTKRANSINPLYPSSMPLSEKINYCEEMYARQNGLDVVFKLTNTSHPSELDAVLEALNYRRVDETSVQTLDLATREFADSALNDGLTVNMSPTLLPVWLDAYTRLSGVSASHVSTVEKMLNNIRIPVPCFISLMQGSDIVAVGLAVRESGHVGLFDIVVAEPLRGQGLGRVLINQLLRWGKESGAHTVYLQVVQSNTTAQRLYARLGFTQQYIYWYRVRSAHDILPLPKASG